MKTPHIHRCPTPGYDAFSERRLIWQKEATEPQEQVPPAAGEQLVGPDAINKDVNNAEKAAVDQAGKQSVEMELIHDLATQTLIYKASGEDMRRLHVEDVQRIAGVDTDTGEIMFRHALGEEEKESQEAEDTSGDKTGEPPEAQKPVVAEADERQAAEAKITTERAGQAATAPEAPEGEKNKLDQAIEDLEKAEKPGDKLQAAINALAALLEMWNEAFGKLEGGEGEGAETTPEASAAAPGEAAEAAKRAPEAPRESKAERQERIREQLNESGKETVGEFKEWKNEKYRESVKELHEKIDDSENGPEVHAEKLETENVDIRKKIRNLEQDMLRPGANKDRIQLDIQVLKNNEANNDKNVEEYDKYRRGLLAKIESAEADHENDIKEIDSMHEKVGRMAEATQRTLDGMKGIDEGLDTLLSRFEVEAGVLDVRMITEPESLMDLTDLAAEYGIDAEEIAEGELESSSENIVNNPEGVLKVLKALAEAMQKSEKEEDEEEETTPESITDLDETVPFHPGESRDIAINSPDAEVFIGSMNIGDAASVTVDGLVVERTKNGIRITPEEDASGDRDIRIGDEFFTIRIEEPEEATEETEKSLEEKMDDIEDKYNELVETATNHKGNEAIAAQGMLEDLNALVAEVDDPSVDAFVSRISGLTHDFSDGSSIRFDYDITNKFVIEGGAEQEEATPTEPEASEGEEEPESTKAPKKPLEAHEIGREMNEIRNAVDNLPDDHPNKADLKLVMSKISSIKRRGDEHVRIALDNKEALSALGRLLGQEPGSEAITGIFAGILILQADPRELLGKLRALAEAKKEKAPETEKRSPEAIRKDIKKVSDIIDGIIDDVGGPANIKQAEKKLEPYIARLQELYAEAKKILEVPVRELADQVGEYLKKLTPEKPVEIASEDLFADLDKQPELLKKWKNSIESEAKRIGLKITVESGEGLDIILRPKAELGTIEQQKAKMKEVMDVAEGRGMHTVKTGGVEGSFAVFPTNWEKGYGLMGDVIDPEEAKAYVDSRRVEEAIAKTDTFTGEMDINEKEQI